MATKPVLNLPGSDAKYDTSVLNTAFETLRDAFQNVLGTDGTSGANNTLSGDLDFGGNKIRNAIFEGSVVGVEWKGAWVTATSYTTNDLVFESDSTYICIESHTSSVFATDLAANKWEVFASAGVTVSGFMATVLDDATAADARTTLDAQQTTPTISQAEAEAGTDTNNRVVTAVRLKQAIDALTTPPTAPTKQIFTASGIWTKPTGCRSVLVRLVGGGGGGGGAATSSSSQSLSGSGGGAGGYEEMLIDVSAITTSTITIGAGGAGGGSGGTGGSNGATTTWSDGTNTLTGTGGTGGRGMTAVSDERVLQGGVGGSGSGGDLTVDGGHGHCGVGMGIVLDAAGGHGGSTPLGAGGAGSHNDGAGGNGKNGSGGGGATTTNSSGVAGGNGGDGMVFVIEYY